MNDDIRWLARLGLDQGLFTPPQCAQVRQKLAADADLMAFAQELIDGGIVEDVEKLELIAGQAVTKAKGGPPPNDPFAAATPTAPAPVATGAASIGFDAVATMDATALAAAMRTLLKSTAAQGASDLHLSTGARPFIREQRDVEPERILRREHVIGEVGEGALLADERPRARREMEIARALGGGGLE